MFANTFQSGFISIFYSVGSNPLQLWDKQVKNGHIRRIVDEEVKSLVLEVGGTNVATTYITCPIKPRLSLGIKLPFLVMIIKNMKKYFTFEIQILDDKDMHRRFRVSNFQSTTKVRPFCTTMPIGLSSGWNQVQFNLADFTKRAYGSTYLETTRVQIHANVRVRRIYFSDVLYSDEDLPNEYKLFVPTPGTQMVQRPQPKKDSKVEKKSSKEEVEPKPEQEPPSGAPPTPTEPETAREEPTAEEAPKEEQPPAEPAAEAPEEPGQGEEIVADKVKSVENVVPVDAPTEAPEGGVETAEATEKTEPAETQESAPEADVFVDAQETPDTVPEEAPKEIVPDEVPKEVVPEEASKEVIPEEGAKEEVAVVETVEPPAEEQVPPEGPVEGSPPAEEPPAEEATA